MDKLKEMIKRRKDEGFTLIELMIVIAVIGILAIVLVPKFGSIKTSAKNTGVTTNYRSVAASVHAVKLVTSDTDADKVAAKVVARLKRDFDGNNALVNPFTKKEDINETNLTDNAAIIITTDTLLTAGTAPVAPKDADDTADYSPYIGAIVVSASVSSDLIPTITVYGCDDAGLLIEGLTEVIEP